MATPIPDAAPSRAAHVLHLAPPDAAFLSRLVLPALKSSDGSAGLRTLVLTADDATAIDVARAVVEISPEATGRVAAITAAARGARVLAARVPTVAIMPLQVAASLLGRSALPIGEIRSAVLALPGRLETPVRDAIDAVMNEVPKGAGRTLVTSRETPEIQALVERHFFKARRIHEDAGAPFSTFNGVIEVIGVGPGARWDVLRRWLDESDPPSAVVVCPDSASQVAARALLEVLGYPADGAVVATTDITTDAPSQIILAGMPTSALLKRAIAARPGRLVVLCGATDIPEMRVLAGPIPVRALSLDGPRARAASREANTRARLREILASGEFARELTTIAPLLDEFDGAEVAAAALALVSEVVRQPVAPAPPPPPPPPRRDRPESAEGSRRPQGGRREPSARPGDRPGGGRPGGRGDFRGGGRGPAGPRDPRPPR